MDIKAKEITMVSIDSLIPHEKNPNKHPDKQIKRLEEIIKYQGFRNPVTVQAGTNKIVCGHGRTIAAKNIGYTEVPVIYQEFESEAQLYAHLVADNAIADWAEQDLAQINLDMIDLGPDLDIDMLGIEDFVLEPVEKFEPQSDEDEVPEIKEDPVTKRGDVWLLGNHRVMCNDSCVSDDVSSLMNGRLADMVHTDPPYNVAYEGGSKKREAIENDNLNNFDEFLNAFYVNYFMNTKAGGAIYVWHASMETHRFIQHYIDNGFLFKSYIIWNKNNSTFGRSDYHWKHEPCIYGWKDGGAHKWHGDRKQTTVWDIERPSRSDEHPTMKPIELCEKPITNSSKPGDLIIDLFLGSGSTLIACEKTGRVCYGMELDERFCDTIIQRWQNYTGKEAVLESTGQTYNELRSQHGNG